MYSIQLRHPFGLLVSGGTKSGKTTFVKRLLSYANVLIDPAPENIIYFYAEYQDAFGEIQNLVPGIKFIQGLPDNIMDSINPETRNLFIIDDMMGEKDPMGTKLPTLVPNIAKCSSREKIPQNPRSCIITHITFMFEIIY